MKIKELFSDESKWTQDAMARNVRGEPCQATDEDAVCWCIAGSIDYCYNDPTENAIVRRKIRGEIYNRFALVFIQSWNDSFTRTFQDVKQFVEELDV